MFFFGIFGINQRKRTIKEFNNIVCPDCDRLSKAELIEFYTYFHFFFIPIFKWNRQYFVKLRCCNSTYTADVDYANRLKHEDSIDFSLLHKLHMPNNICPNCKNYISPSFAYCPYCGQKLS